MKSVKELGLEVIELEDQVLLVDKNTVEGSMGYILIGKGGTIGKVSYDSKYKTWDVTTFDGIHYPFSNKEAILNIISSTKPLEGIPLLVIEDEVEELIDKEMIKMGHEPKRVRSVMYGEDRELAKAVYNKTKETYKFTEEDLRKAINYGYSRGFLDGECNREEFSSREDEIFIQHLTKKELWVDAYWDCCGRCIDGEDKCTATWELNIENNQIKAVWK